MSTTTPFDCPRCGVGLAMSERQGIEIDYCPQCRGVWLDRGELDKIIDRAGAAFDAAARPQPRDERGRDRYDDDDRRWRDDPRPHEGGHGDPRRRRKKSFLDDIFDFD